MLTSGNFGCTPDPQEAALCVFQEVVRERRSWKTLKGNGEAVWPPELEVALIEGLVNYEPIDSRETRLLGRFPLRNKFISNYILRATGKHRSPKQVGSRLQQLRDTCGGKQLVQLLSHSEWLNPSTDRCPPSPYAARPLSLPSACGGSMPPARTMCTTVADTATPWDLPSDENNTGSRPARTQIYIHLIPDYTTWSELAGKDDSISILDSLPAGGSPSTFRPSSQPRSIWNIDPTVTFVYHSIISSFAFFAVFLDGYPVHTEMTPLIQLDTFLPSGNLLYTTPLVPGYWKTICQSVDPTRYSIAQEVFSNSGLPSTTDKSQRVLLFSAVYEFSYPPRKPPPRLSDSPPMDCLAPPNTTIVPPDICEAFQEFLQADVTKLPDSPIGGSYYTFGNNVDTGCNMAPIFVDDDSARSGEHIFTATRIATQGQEQENSDNGTTTSPVSTAFPMDLFDYASPSGRE